MFDDVFGVEDFMIFDEDLDTNESEEEAFSTGIEPDIFTTGEKPDIFTTRDI